MLKINKEVLRLDLDNTQTICCKLNKIDGESTLSDETKEKRYSKEPLESLVELLDAVSKAAYGKEMVSCNMGLLGGGHSGDTSNNSNQNLKTNHLLYKLNQIVSDWK